MGIDPKIAVCRNPKCGRAFLRTERAQKYCTFKCGDALRSQAYRKRNPSTIRAKTKLKWATHKVVLSARHRAWATANVEHRLDYNRRYRSIRGANYFRECWRRWYRKNKRKWADQVANRRALRSHRVSCFEILTEEEWQALVTVWRGRCAYCGGRPDKLTQDHVIPLSKGGEHVMSNVVPACLSCNSSKSDRDVEDFERDLAERVTVTSQPK